MNLILRLFNKMQLDNYVLIKSVVRHQFFWTGNIETAELLAGRPSFVEMKGLSLDIGYLSNRWTSLVEVAAEFKLY